MTQNRRELIEKVYSEFWNTHDHLKDKSLDELKAICKADSLPFAVCALNITGDLNVGMMMRAASIFGAERFFIIGSKNYDRRSTVGAQNYIDVIRISSVDNDGHIDTTVFFNTMTEYGYTPVFIETGGKDITEMSWDQNIKYCLVFGNEGFGIQSDLMIPGSLIVGIKQRGVLRSLNVSSAASIVLHNHSTFLSNLKGE